MAKTKINREYALQRLQQNKPFDGFLKNTADYRNLMDEFKKILLETTVDTARDNILNASSDTHYLVMLCFQEAIKNRDYDTMKGLLHRMFAMQSTLHDVYFKVLKDSSDIFSPNTMAREIHENLIHCQKKLVNLTNYNQDDVWLLVMLECLRPVSGVIPLSTNFKWSFQDLSGLRYDSKNEDEAKKYQAECEMVNAKIIGLTQYFTNHNVELLSLLSQEEEKLKDLKKDMEWQNTLFNIVNIFAWLPLLLTNIKRACFNQPFRLFHYIGAEYGQRLAFSMMDVIAPHVAQPKAMNTKFQYVITHANKIKSALLLFDTPVDDEVKRSMRALTAFITHHRAAFSDEVDFSKLSTSLGQENAHYVYDVYRLQNAYTLIKAKRSMNYINFWLSEPWPIQDTQLIEIANQLKEQKNQLVKDYKDRHNGDIVGLLINDNQSFKDVSQQTMTQVRKNQQAVALITQLILATLPIHVKDFELFFTATQGLNCAVSIMNTNQWLTRELLTRVLETYSKWDTDLCAKFENGLEISTNEESIERTSALEEKLKSLCTEYNLNAPDTLKVVSNSMSMK